MRDTSELSVVMLSDKAWEQLQIVPITEAVPVEAWLKFVEEQGMRISAEPYSRIEGGEYDGGHVLTLDNFEGRSYFAVPAAAIPMLRPYMTPDGWEDLMRRSPKLQHTMR